MLGTENVGPEALQNAKRDAADEDAGDAAQATEDADHEGLTQIGGARQRGNGKDRAQQGARSASHAGADAERDGEDDARVDAHQGRGITVHADRHDGATDRGAAQEPVEQRNQHDREGHARQTVHGHDDVDGGQVVRHVDDAERRLQIDLAEIRLEGVEHQVVEEQRQPEREGQRHQDRGIDDAVDERILHGEPDDEQQQGRDRHEQVGVDAEQRVGEEREIRAQHDERAVQDVDDVEHPPDEGEAARYGGIDPAE